MAPCHNDMIAKKSRNAVMVCWTWAADAPRLSLMAGSDGRYVSIENGPIQVRAASTNVRPALLYPAGICRSLSSVSAIVDIRLFFNKSDALYFSYAL